MTVLEPPERPEGEPVPEVIDEAPIVVPQVVEPIKTAKDVCADCLRPILVTGTDDEGNDSWGHWDPRIDNPENPAFHFAGLFVEPPIKWGFLDTRGKSEFEVEHRGLPSRGGGVAA